jgi:hypothetical protein
MHRCLQVPEIIQYILNQISSAGLDFESVDEWPCEVPREHRIALAHMARTCTAFYEPAMDALWKNVTSLNSLLKCLPALNQKAAKLSQEVRPTHDFLRCMHADLHSVTLSPANY